MLQTLQNDRMRHGADNGPAFEHEENGGIGDLINFVIGFVRRQYLLILFVTALALAASFIYLRITPPTYTSQAKVLFVNPKAEFLQQQSLLADNPLDRAQFESQIQILRSKAIAIAVINQLKLADDPDLNGSDQPVRRLSAKLKRMLNIGSDNSEAEQDDGPSDGLIAAFDDRLRAERIGYSAVIEISFSSSNPERAAEIANTVANVYIADQLNAKFDANRRATLWLQGRLNEIGEQALTAERAVAVFKSQNNIVTAGGKLMDDQQVADLNSRLVAARAVTADAQARLNRFEASIRASNNDAGQANANLDASITDTLNSPIINNLRQQYLEFARRAADWSTRFGKNHLAVINLHTRMQDLRSSIMNEVRRLAEASRSDYEIAKQKQTEVEKQLAQAVSQSRTVNSAETTMRELETKAKSYRSLYESFLQRYMGAVQQESFPISEARVISPAFPPQGKSKPKASLILALGLFGGLALGTALGLLRDIMDRVFRTAAQVETTLRLPSIALIPLVKETKHIPPRKEPPPNKPLPPRTITRHSGVIWTATEMPLSRFAESIRSIRLAIDLHVTDTSNKVVGITSSLPNEGKSTIAAALAQLIAHAGARVIVVDCDLRNPSLSRSLAPEATAGLVEVIAGHAPLEEVIWRDPKTNMDFLPTVKKRPLFHTSEILSATSTRKLFDTLRANYDYVVVDLPPLAPVIDVRATTSLIDCFILAVEWGCTKTDVVQHALHTAPNLREALIGVVLNKTDMNAIKSYDGYHNDYYNNKHYTRYGYTS
ncbi:protein tyrosine kinase [Afipia sp. Root123D2]|uniref:polysaccharide biosynthesis tyrosine autokinase n=1 Tax=Afipia sp. Root123D2 TaxID=1736436 RepID=UPI0006F88814|nr:polysaccharide biosynthesis tyrosine autokinase [Afipia sp. Root123D2]KQW22235.1 protein tyrosine kinase [Afipia sp. Root123D2]